jgi:hypothetical protein
MNRAVLALILVLCVIFALGDDRAQSASTDAASSRQSAVLAPAPIPGCSSLPTTSSGALNPLLVRNVTIRWGRDFVDGVSVDNEALVGGTRGHPHDFSLADDDYIVQVLVYKSEYVEGLEFKTHNNISFGRPTRHSQTINTHSAPKGRGMVGFHVNQGTPAGNHVVLKTFVPNWAKAIISVPLEPATSCQEPVPAGNNNPAPISSSLPPSSPPTSNNNSTEPVYVLPPSSNNSSEPIFEPSLSAPSPTSPPSSFQECIPSPVAGPEHVGSSYSQLWSPNVVTSITVRQGDYVDGIIVGNNSLVGGTGGSPLYYSWTNGTYIVSVKVFIFRDGYLNSLVFTSNTGSDSGRVGSGTVIIYTAPAGFALTGYSAAASVTPWGKLLLYSFVPVWGPVYLNVSVPTGETTTPPHSCWTPPMSAPSAVPEPVITPSNVSSNSSEPVPAPTTSTPVPVAEPIGVHVCPPIPDTLLGNPDLVTNITVMQGDYVDGVIVDSGPLVGAMGGGPHVYTWGPGNEIRSVKVYVSYGFVNSLVFTSNTGQVQGLLGSVTNWPGIVSNITTFTAPAGYAMVGYNATARLNIDPYYGRVLVDSFTPYWGSVYINLTTPSAPPCVTPPAAPPVSPPPVHCSYTNGNEALVNTIIVRQGDYINGVTVQDAPHVGGAAGDQHVYYMLLAHYIVSVKVYVSNGFVNSLVFTSETGEVKGTLGAITSRPHVVSTITTFNAPEGYGMVGAVATAKLNTDPSYGIVMVDSFVPVWEPARVPICPYSPNNVIIPPNPSTSSPTSEPTPSSASADPTPTASPHSSSVPQSSPSGSPHPTPPSIPTSPPVSGNSSNEIYQEITTPAAAPALIGMSILLSVAVAMVFALTF